MSYSSHNQVTIIDVAQRAGVSKSTASRVLAGHGSVSPSAHEKVTTAARELGYTPNALAQAMVSGSSKTIGVIIPDVASPFFSTVVRGLSDAARTAGFEVIISNTDNDVDIENRMITLLAGKRVDGFIIAPVFHNTSAVIRSLTDRGVPLVMLDRRGIELADVPLVSLDHVRAAELATNHLLDLGHRDIAITTESWQTASDLADGHDEPRFLRPSTQRLIGYLSAMRARGIEPDPQLMIHTAYDRADAAAKVTARLTATPTITALFGTDSMLTSGSFDALLDLGVSYPSDLSFVGFDDQDWSSLVRPAVTVVSQPRYRLGATTATCLIERMRHPESQLDDIRLPATLVVRNSTAKLA